jgi:alpha-mannosidase
VVSRLTELDQLQAEEWPFHAGDLAHGESTDLDDSGWPLVKERSVAGQEAVWFRRWIEVPQSHHGYDLTGARIWFAFHADANGPMPEIIYFSGRRVALGDDLEPIILFDRAKPGDMVPVAVKLLHTVDKKTFGGSELKIRIPSGARLSSGRRAFLPSSGSRRRTAAGTAWNEACLQLDLASRFGSARRTALALME